MNSTGSVIYSQRVLVGEIYAKQNSSKLSMYNVLKVHQGTVTLQNIDNPLSLFETSAQKLFKSGYLRISQTPFVDLTASSPRKRKAVKKPNRCPYTMDFLEARADSQKPAPIFRDLFGVT